MSKMKNRVHVNRNKRKFMKKRFATKSSLLVKKAAAKKVLDHAIKKIVNVKKAAGKRLVPPTKKR